MVDSKILAESLLENSVKERMMMESETSTSDAAACGELLFPLLEKIYSQTLVSQIASVQPIKSPVGKVAAVFSQYGGFKSAADNAISIVASGSNLSLNDFFETSRVIAIEGNCNLPVGTSISVSGSSVVPNVKVLYSENIVFDTQVPTNSIAVSALAASGLSAADGPYTTTTVSATFALVNNWVPMDTLDAAPGYTVITTAATGTNIPVSGAQLIMCLANRTAIKKYFSKYSGNFSGFVNASNYTNYATDDSNGSIRYIDYMTRAVTIETKTRKIASKLSYEKVQDMKEIYKKNYKDVVGKVVGQEIAAEIDIEVINYLKEIAKPMNDINLTYSLGIGNSTIMELSSDLIANINIAVEDIVKTTKRNRTMFILADSTTIGYLQGNPLYVKSEENSDNPWRVGTLGSYPLFCDMFSDSHYILIGYMYKSDEKGDAGLLYAPYSHTMYEFKDDQNQFQPKLVTFNRYGYTRHPQDTGIGVGDSDFFRIFEVSYNGKSPLTPSGTYDIPSLTKAVLNYI